MIKTVAALVKIGLEDWSSESSVRCGKRSKIAILLPPGIFFFPHCCSLLIKGIYFIRLFVSKMETSRLFEAL